MAVSVAVLGCERRLWQLSLFCDGIGSSGQTNIVRKAFGVVKQSRGLKVIFDWMRRFPVLSENWEYHDLCGHSHDDTF